MFDRILAAIDATDWSRPYVVMTIVAALLIVYVMNLTSYEHEDQDDPPWLQWVRRTGYLLTAGSLLWSLVFMQARGWQPWPPVFFLLTGIIVGSLVRITAIHLRIRREGSRRHPVEIPRGLINRNF